jgi:hypothetical protein
LEENIDLLEDLNKFNMLNIQLLNFRVNIEREEDKVIFQLTLLLPSYDHLVTALLYGKETLELTGSLLLHETWRKPVNDQANGLVVRSQLKCGRISQRERMAEVSSVGLSHVWQRMKNLSQMQKMWNAIIFTRKSTTKYFARC